MTDPVTDNPVSTVDDRLDPRAVLDAALPEEAEWDEREVVLLAILERQAKHIEKLEAAVEEHGYMVLGSTGQLRVSPALVELRQWYSAMTKTTEGIRLPGEEKTVAVRQQRAANKRWDKPDAPPAPVALDTWTPRAEAK
ncbi:MAG: hypothetical protein PGN24_03705 [Microbacterium arborescens]